MGRVPTFLTHKHSYDVRITQWFFPRCLWRGGGPLLKAFQIKEPVDIFFLFFFFCQWIFSSVTLRMTTGNWMVMWVLPWGLSNHHVCVEVGAPIGIPSKTTWVLSALWKLRALILAWWPLHHLMEESRPWDEKETGQERQAVPARSREPRCRPHPTVSVGLYPGLSNHPAWAEKGKFQMHLHSLLCKLTLCFCTNSSWTWT